MANSSRCTDDSNFAKPKAYKIRPGTIDFGCDYQRKIIALLALRCFGADQEHMWAASDAKDCLHFDDIVVHRQTKTGHRIINMIAVTYRLSSKPITETEFLDRKGPFSIHRILYNRTVLNKFVHDKTSATSIISNCLKQAHEINFIVFTNSSLKNIEFLKKVDEKSDLHIFNTHGSIHSVDIESLTLKLDASSTDFRRNVFFFTGQVDHRQLDDEIRSTMANVLSFSFKVNVHFSGKYEKNVIRWFRRIDGRNYCLDERQIAEFLLEPYFENTFYHSKYANDYQLDQINDWICISKNKNPIVINMKDTTNAATFKLLWRFYREIVDRRNFCSYTENWEELLTPSQLQTDGFNSKDIKLEMRKTVGSERITAHDLYKVLWRLGRIPLVLKVYTSQDYEIVLSILERTHYSFKVIILNMGEEVVLPTSTGNSVPFSSFADLNQCERDFIANRIVKLQGRPVQLKNIIAKVKDFNMDVGQIIQLLNNDFHIGNSLVELPKHYIHRKYLPRRTLEPYNDMRVTSYEKLIVHQIIQIPSYCRIVKHRGSSDSCPIVDGQSELIHDLEPSSSNVREFVETSSDSSTMQKTQLNQPQIVEFALPEPGEIKIITGAPGIGKTTFLNNLARNTSTDLWVLQFSMREIAKQEDLVSLSAYECLIHLNKDLLDQDMFKSFLDTNSVLLLLDGLEEVRELPMAIRLINLFKSANYRICLAVRPVLQHYAEQILQTNCFILPKFDKKEQHKLLVRYFANRNQSDEQTVEEFSANLLEKVEEKLPHYEQPLTGIPLHIELIADLFQGRLDSLFERNNFMRNLNLLELCQQLILGKRKILIEKYDESTSDYNESYCRGDHKSIAVYHLFNHLSDTYTKQWIESITLEKSVNIQKDGIVVRDGKLSNLLELPFVDGILAEYFVALWVIEHEEDEKAKLILNQNYGIINTLVASIKCRMS